MWANEWLVPTTLGLLALGLCAGRVAEDLFRRPDHAPPNAVGALKAIANAQLLYREGDKDGDGVRSYAARLEDLIDTGPGGDEDLIYEGLATGPQRGYVFAITSVSATGWTATARPRPSRSDRPAFGINHRGEVFASADPALVFSPDGRVLNGRRLGAE